ncbi:ATP-dependent DNA helicase [Trichinella spiralis]|uniref:ATP-dependent DNA helicase n=1 Tax=Trichinella spiralis TaxID=6334 RepID=A0ABR3KQW7_TRISP
MPQHLPATWSMLGRGTLLLLTPTQEIQQKNMKKKKKRPTNHFPPDDNTSIQSHQISTIHFNLDQQLDQQVKKIKVNQFDSIQPDCPEQIFAKLYSGEKIFNHRDSEIELIMCENSFIATTVEFILMTNIEAV